jgi:NADH-quinone oxidoreductase subunit F
MSPTSDQELIETWRDQPAPLLPVLHAFHDRDGFLSEDAIRSIASGLRIPLAELYTTISFYHHLATEPGGKEKPRVCDGPVCRLRGAENILRELGEGATTMPCPGRCDEPVAILRGDEVALGLSAGELTSTPSPLPAPNPGGLEECVFGSIREEGRSSLDGYKKTGGYQALRKAVEEMSPPELIDELSESGLAGRGGAGFPTGQKWRAVAEAEGHPKTIVCNADEGEPGCFKDRAIMDHDPHAVIEGMALAARATGAIRGFIYLRYEYPGTFSILERALSDAEEGGFLGDNILGVDGFDFRIYLRRGAGAYICGEEGSLLNSLEGKHPFPRNRPPYPVTHGFEDLPTVVNNVETLVSAPPIVLRGANWYQSLGEGDHAGTKIISLSGDIARPGNYEVPIGLPLSTLLHDWAGGPAREHDIQAVTMAGLSGGFLAGDDLDVTLDEPSIRSRGSFLGAGGIIVFDQGRDMVTAAENAMEFFADESCGKCFPCRIGTRRLTERLGGRSGPTEMSDWESEVRDIGKVMKATSACGLGMAAPLITESLLKYFQEEVELRLK